LHSSHRFVLPLLVAVAACAAAPAESPAVTHASAPLLSSARPATAAETPPTETADASISAGPDSACAEESETLEIALTTQHSKTKKGGGFVVRVANPTLKLDEKFLDTSLLESGYSCCVHAEMEAVSYSCELADGAVNARVYREKDELVIEASQGHPEKRVPIPCGAWLRFRGPAKDCEGSPAH
jgi:hypothetical protein